MKQREDVFIIVEDAPFDVLICSKLWKVDSAKTGLFLFGRNKSKGMDHTVDCDVANLFLAEKWEQKEKAKKAEKDAQIMIKEQLKEAEKHVARG